MNPWYSLSNLQMKKNNGINAHMDKCCSFSQTHRKSSEHLRLHFTQLEDQGLAGWLQEARAQWQCSLFIRVLSRGKTWGRGTVYLELFHCGLAASVEAVSSELACTVSVFQLEKFDFCFPDFLSLFAARGCEFTEANGSTFSETQFCRPGVRTAAFSRRSNSELRGRCESLAGLICSSNQSLFLDMDPAKMLW